jgi:hypothetical protein
MFVLMPFFATLAAILPILRTARFAAGMATYLPYAILGFVPLLVFDYLQSHPNRSEPGTMIRNPD